MVNTVTFVDYMYFLELLLQASEETLHSSNEEEDPFHGMEPYLVRRLSCRNIQLPPLAFRQLEQADLKSESENIQRPTSLPLKILPLIAITSADSSGWAPSRCHFPILYFRCDCYLWSFEFLWLIAWFEWENNGVSRVKKKGMNFSGDISISAGEDILVKLFYKEELKMYWWMLINICKRAVVLGKLILAICDLIEKILTNEN